MIFQSMAHTFYLFPGREGYLWSFAHFGVDFSVNYYSLSLGSVPLRTDQSSLPCSEAWQLTSGPFNGCPLP